MFKGRERVTYREELSLFSVEKNWLRGSVSGYKSFLDGSKLDRARCFSGVPRKRRRNNEQELKHNKLHLNIRITFSGLRVAEHWARLSRQLVESSSLEILRTWLDMPLSNQLYLILLRGGGFE